MKTFMITIIALVIAFASIFAACTFSPTFREAYTGFSNKYEAKCHHFIEDHTGIDLPYTQYTADGRIVVVK